MDLFLAHISSHDVPGGLWTTLYTTFLVALAAYLLSIANNQGDGYGDWPRVR
jgi:hypothetical protein